MRKGSIIATIAISSVVIPMVLVAVTRLLAWIEDDLSAELGFDDEPDTED